MSPLHLAHRGILDSKRLAAIVKRYGSPVFVVSEEALRAAYWNLADSFRRLYPETIVAYSYKTNYLRAICAVFHEEGAWAEVVSGFEFEEALALGRAGDTIIFNGPYKTRADLEGAVAAGARIHLDGPEEMAALEGICRRMRRRAAVGVRVTMSIGDLKSSKFGFVIENGDALAACQKASRSKFLRLQGVHTHLGTMKPSTLYGEMMRRLLSFADAAEVACRFPFEYIDIGGGFISHGSPSWKEDFLGVDEHARAVCSPLQAWSSKRSKRPMLIIEPGRALVESSVVLLATVVATKVLSDGVKAVILDAGINILPSAMHSTHDVVALNSELRPLESVNIYGPLCAEFDVIRSGIKLASPRTGDVLCLLDAGAYSISCSPQFMYPRPAVVLAGAKREAVIRARETPEDIRRLEKISSGQGLAGRRGRR